MSNIYIQEPPTHGKVLLVTTVGDIDIELWPREAPKACRNFVQLCMEGYYDGTLFHRIVKGFIVQGGDPTGTGTGGESIYGRPFKDEFHTRLRFVRRGLVALANAGKDDNGSQFFFTMGPCPELQSKHTIFGKVVGDTLYNMLKLEDGLVDREDRPLYPNKILSTQILMNPFPDIVPRVQPSKVELALEEAKKKKSRGTKNFKLLSFGEEAEEDEEETDIAAKEYRGKSKSSHDLANDPSLSSVPAVDSEVKPKKRKNKSNEDDSGDSGVEETRRENLDKIRKKLKKDEKSDEPNMDSLELAKKTTNDQVVESKTIEEGDLEQIKKVEGIREEVRKLKKELASSKKKDNDPQADPLNDGDEQPQNEALSEYYDTFKKYSDKKKEAKEVSKNTSHEERTLAMLDKFRSKLLSAREKDSSDSMRKDKTLEEDKVEEEGDGGDDDEGWWTHTLQFESHDRLAKDANMANEDTFEIYDPRNPINQRRREASKKVMKDKKHRK